MARVAALATALAVALLAVSGSGGAATQQTPKRGGTVVFGPVREPPCLTTFLQVCQGTVLTPSFQWIARSVLPPAFIVGSGFTLRPRLASRVEYTKGPPFTLTYHIRPEARWSDGVPVTARDFEFTHAVIRRFVASDSNDVHLQVRSVRRIGAKTVRVVLRSRRADWRNLFWTVLPRHALAGADLARIWTDRIDVPRTGRPIGSGPFLVARWDRGRQVTLVRNPRYWGPHVAHLDRVVIRFCREVCSAPPPGEVLEALRGGDVDFVYSRDTTIASELRRIPRVKVLAGPTAGLEHFDIRKSTGHPALQSKLVRRALIYGIDRVAIARRIFAEVAPAARLGDSSVFPNSSSYYRPNWSRYRYRPARARRLLEQAGCRRGADRIYVCADRRMSLRVSLVAGQRLRELTVQLAQEHLRQVGVEVVPAYGGGEADLHLFAWFVGPEPLLKDVYGCGGSQNFVGYCQRLVTRDLDQADRILRPGQRAAVLNRVDRQLAKDVPVIPLYEVPIVYAHRTNLRGLDPAPFDPFWNVEDWWLASPR